MEQRINQIRVLLAIALFLMALIAFICAVGYFGAPFQQIEVRAELEQSQATGVPISNAEIENQLSRVASQYYVHGTLFVLSGLAGIAILAAFFLTASNLRHRNC
jgi:hypothetical protein